MIKLNRITSKVTKAEFDQYITYHPEFIIDEITANGFMSLLYYDIDQKTNLMAISITSLYEDTSYFEIIKKDE